MRSFLQHFLRNPFLGGKKLLTASSTQKVKGHNAVPWLRPIVAGVSPPRPVFDPRSFHVNFVLDNVVKGQFSLRVLLSTHLNMIPSMLHTLFHLHVTLTRSTNGRQMGILQKAVFFVKSESAGLKSTFTF